MTAFTPGDASTQQGAKRLCQNIEAYWAARGLPVVARMTRTGEFRPKHPAFGVESNVRLERCTDGGWRAVV